MVWIFGSVLHLDVTVTIVTIVTIVKSHPGVIVVRVEDLVESWVSLFVVQEVNKPGVEGIHQTSPIPKE